MSICPCEHADHEGPGDEPVWAPILFLDDGGTAYEWTRCGGYAPLRLDWAIEGALFTWFASGFFTDDDRAAVLAAYTRSHASVAEQ